MPKNIVLLRTEDRSPGVIGKTMYAAIARTLPTIETKNSAMMRRSWLFSFSGRGR